MWWFRRDHKTRAEDLSRMAESVWQRRSKRYFDKLEVKLSEDPKNPFVVVRNGKASKPMKTTRQVERYVSNFYDNLLINGNDAPNDIFLDSMNSVTKKGK